MSEFIAIVQELKKLRENDSPESKLGWYLRHQTKKTTPELTKAESAEKKPEPEPETNEDYGLGLLG